MIYQHVTGEFGGGNLRRTGGRGSSWRDQATDGCDMHQVHRRRCISNGVPVSVPSACSTARLAASSLEHTPGRSGQPLSPGTPTPAWGWLRRRPPSLRAEFPRCRGRRRGARADHRSAPARLIRKAGAPLSPSRVGRWRARWRHSRPGSEPPASPPDRCSGRSARGERLRNARLTDRSVAKIVKAHAVRVGLDPAVFAGHSLRSGFLTSAAARGASIFKMADQSRHRSMDTAAGLRSRRRDLQGSRWRGPVVDAALVGRRAG